MITSTPKILTAPQVDKSILLVLEITFGSGRGFKNVITLITKTRMAKVIAIRLRNAIFENFTAILLKHSILAMPGIRQDS